MFLHINLWLVEFRLDINLWLVKLTLDFLPTLFGRRESEISQQNKQKSEAASQSSQGEQANVEGREGNYIDEEKRIEGPLVAQKS